MLAESEKLPIGIQYFPRIREEGYVYVDKTELIYKMINGSVGAFLSRPRRFGKSLLVSTLESLFLAQKKLFEGLWIEGSDYSWEECHIIKMDFSRLASHSTEALESSLQNLLSGIARKHGLTDVLASYPNDSIVNIIERLGESRRVVVLIDEYDKPLVSHHDDVDLMSSNKKLISDFFMAIKSLQEWVRFAFVTGVSRFTKVSLFSGMNNLDDLSLNPDYNSLLGLTDEEISFHFQGHLKKAASAYKTDSYSMLDLMREWYDGYRFCQSKEVSRVYNPLSSLMFLRDHRLDTYWFSTATPTFAIELIKSREFPVVKFEEGTVAGKEIEESHEVDKVDLTTLLYQTGYLTIKDYDEKTGYYQLGFPNEEVRRSFVEHLLKSFSGLHTSDLNRSMSKLAKFIDNEDLDSFVTIVNSMLASTPYQLHLKKEAYYHSLIYLILRTLGFKVGAEVCTSRGRIDMVLETEHSIFIFEFKLDTEIRERVQQVLDRKYHEKFATDKRKIVLVAMSFCSEKRQISDWTTQFS